VARTFAARGLSIRLAKIVTNLDLAATLLAGPAQAELRRDLHTSISTQSRFVTRA
jgi:hypothetical protein